MREEVERTNAPNRFGTRPELQERFHNALNRLRQADADYYREIRDGHAKIAESMRDARTEAVQKVYEIFWEACEGWKP